MTATVSVGGTQTGTLSLPFLGIPDVAPTGKSVRNPDERIRVAVRDGKVANVHVDNVPGGSVSGILTQLGVTLHKSGRDFPGRRGRNIILPVQNAVPAPADPDSPVAARVASRTLAVRSEAYADEVRRLVDAGYAVMRRTGSLEPRVTDIVREAGLSNQAFYRHFTGKDELLVAILDDGQRQLVTYLERRMSGAATGDARVRAWIEGVMEQARNAAAAENTRPFAINSARLADRFPDEIARSRELLVRPLREAVAEVGGNPQRDADAVYHLVIGCMNDALVARRRPSKEDVEHLEQFVLGGLRGT